MTKIEKLYKEVCAQEEHLTLEDNIKQRLQKTLNNYIEELDSASDRIRSKKITTVYKELGK